MFYADSEERSGGKRDGLLNNSADNLCDGTSLGLLGGTPDGKVSIMFNGKSDGVLSGTLKMKNRKVLLRACLIEYVGW